MINNLNNYTYLEKKLFNKNRFAIQINEKKELKKLFNNSNILISGACGSIGYPITNEILKFNFKKLFLLDKNENVLTELNREIVLNKETKIIKKISYICTDITTGCIDSIIEKNKINIYLNLAAVKHVRSEENINSIKYMFKTNSDLFIPKKNYKFLKIIFSISSDKAVYPSSMLGLSKLFMEKKLLNYHNKHKSTSICCTRFANVSFSNGSILKLISDRLDSNQIFGVPENIKRFFITHDEAKNLCLKTLLKKNHNKILVPSFKSLGKNFLIKNLVFEIARLKDKKIKVLKNNKKIINGNYVVFTKSNITGQKQEEELYFKYEEVKYDSKKEIFVIDFSNKYFSQNTLNEIYKLKSISSVIKYLNKKVPIFKNNAKSLNLKHSI